MEKKVILYKKKGQAYNVIECEDLKEGHEKFNLERSKGNFDYLELGIDKEHIDGTYKVVRSIKN